MSALAHFPHRHVRHKRLPHEPHGRAGGMLARLRRGLAIALLPASILPVLVLGPGIARAPQTLVRSAVAQLSHLERGDTPAVHRAPMLTRPRPGPILTRPRRGPSARSAAR